MVLTMGFIGFGKSATRYHFPYLKIRDNFKVKTVYSRNFPPQVIEHYQDYGINFTTDLTTLLNDVKIDLVSICTPPATHYELAKQVIESGKSAIVEKPFCDTLSQARELFDLALKHKVLVIPYQNRRFDGDFLATKQVIEQGFLGDILEVESHIDYYRPQTMISQGNPEDGAFYGLGIHLIDRMVSLFGRPKKVVYDLRNNEVEQGIDNYFDVDLHYNHQLKVKVKASFLVAEKYPRFIVQGTRGSFVKYGEDQQENDLKAGLLPGDPNFGLDSPIYYGKLKYHNNNGDWITRQVQTPVGDYGRFYDSVYQSLVHGKPKLVRDQEALTDMEILTASFSQPAPFVYELK